MTYAPQGIAYFGGVQAFLGFDFTLTPGISPSVATLTIPPQPGQVFEVGPLLLTYGSTQLVFPDCKLDNIAVDWDREGREVWVLPILDRRWKWAFGGKISGYYNVRRGDRLVEETEKTPRELAELCLDAMGETRTDVSGMPNDTRPEIEWDYENPAQALAQLADSVGCQVVLRTNNWVTVERKGHGAALQLGADVLASNVEFDPAEVPDKLIFAAGHSRWQGDFKLEAVGQDVDGRVKPIAGLSYAPTIQAVPGWNVSTEGTWALSDPPHFNAIQDTKARELARATVFRWYRIVPGFRLPVGTRREPVETLDRVLPIEDRQVETWNVDDPGRDGPREEPRPAWVYGRYYRGHEDTRDATEEVQHDLENYPEGMYTRSFTVDRELGIVQFSEPVYRYEHAPGLQAWVYRVADLRLRTAVSLRDKETRGWIRWERARTKSGRKHGTQPRYLRHDDVTFARYYDHTTRRWKDNERELRAAAEYYLDVAAGEYSLQTPGSVTYAGFKPISPDGAIQQVTWTVTEQGHALTRASRNTEDLTRAPSFRERRFLERLRDTGDGQRETGRQRAERTRRAQA